MQLLFSMQISESSLRAASSHSLMSVVHRRVSLHVCIMWLLYLHKFAVLRDTYSQLYNCMWRTPRCWCIFDHKVETECIHFGLKDAKLSVNHCTVLSNITLIVTTVLVCICCLPTHWVSVGSGSVYPAGQKHRAVPLTAAQECEHLVSSRHGFWTVFVACTQ